MKWPIFGDGIACRYIIFPYLCIAQNAKADVQSGHGYIDQVNIQDVNDDSRAKMKRALPSIERNGRFASFETDEKKLKKARLVKNDQYFAIVFERRKQIST